MGDPKPEDLATQPKAVSRLVGGLLAALVVAAILVAVFTSQQPAAPLGAGSAAPDFQLPTVDGKQASLSDYRGQVVLLNFWATWCKPCQDEMPSMQKLYEQLKGEGFVLVAVSVDEDKNDVSGFRDAYGLSFPVLLDPSMEVANLYQTYRYPESLLIDRKGTVLSRFVGPRDWLDPLIASRFREVLAGGAKVVE